MKSSIGNEGQKDYMCIQEQFQNELNLTSPEKLVKKMFNSILSPYERWKSLVLVQYLDFARRKNRIGNSHKGNSWYGYDFDDNIKHAVTGFEGRHNRKPQSDEELSFILNEARKMSMLTMLGWFFKQGDKVSINKTLATLFSNTKNAAHARHCPFDIFVIELGEYELIENVEIFAVLVCNRLIGTKKELCQDIYTFGYDKRDKAEFYLKTVLHEKRVLSGFSIDKYKSLPGMNDWGEGDLKKIEELSLRIVANLLDMINHPEVEIIKKSMEPLNIARREKNRFSLPTEVSINLTGKLKRYVDETSQQNEKAWKLGHRFWVRGHWKHFKSDKYKNKQGQKTWVLPYIKGKGELIKKDYYIGEKEQCWEHEKQMIQIIRQIYPDQEIKTHDRTALDGLEIDCHVPNLKLGFEYNGQQHYEQVKIFHKTVEEFEAQQARDVEKLRRAKAKGIRIITIKYDEPLTEEAIRAKI